MADTEEMPYSRAEASSDDDSKHIHPNGHVNEPCNM